MHALSTTHPMSKITRLAISWKLIDQRKKSRSGEYIFTPLYWFWGQNSKYKWRKIFIELFGHLFGHLMAQQMTLS